MNIDILWMLRIRNVKGAEHMKAKVLLICAMMFASLFVIAATPVEAAPNYSWTHYDPAEDVLRVRTGGDFKFASWDNVEITKMTSRYIDSTPLDKIELTMKVEGTIQNNEDYKYVFIVESDSDDYIFAAYQEGAAVGWKVGEILPMGPSALVSAQGEGTDTLTITFNANAIGPPSSKFEFSGTSIYSEGDYLRYLDLATPDKLILITEPSDGSTVSGTVTIRGVLMQSEDNQPSGDVKIKVGSGNWEEVTGSDSWSYSLDTTSLSGDVKIKVQVDDAGSVLDNAEDEITIKVDQNTGNYDFFDQKPPIHIGDYYEYEALGTTSISGIDLTGTNEMRTEVVSVESITVDGKEYETYKMHITSEGSQELGYIIYTNYVDRLSWRDMLTYGTVKDYTESYVTVTLGDPTLVTTTTEYSRPFETHNAFSVSEGFINDANDNRWTTYSTANSESITEVEGQNPVQNPSYTDILEVTGECLYYKPQHSVFGHTFQDIYLIKTYYENPGISVIEYYSPELGVPVQIDTFDTSRNPLFSLGLRDWEQMPFSVIIDEVTFDPTPPKAETENKIKVKIRNVGNENTEDFTITVKDGDRQVAQQTVSSILSGESTDEEIKWTPKSKGNHSITVTLSYGSSDLVEKIYYVNVGSPPEDDSFPLVLLLLPVIIIVIVVILAVVLMKRKKEDLTPEGEVPTDQAPSVEASAAAPVTVAAEAEPVVVPQAQAAPQMISEAIVCPSCKQNFTIQYESKPVRVKCPSCATEGVLN